MKIATWSKVTNSTCNWRTRVSSGMLRRSIMLRERINTTKMANLMEIYRVRTKSKTQLRSSLNQSSRSTRTRKFAWAILIRRLWRTKAPSKTWAKSAQKNKSRRNRAHNKSLSFHSKSTQETIAKTTLSTKLSNSTMNFLMTNTKVTQC